MPRIAVKNYQIQEVDDDEVDYEIPNPERLVGSHANNIPMAPSVSAPRTFYGSRFYDQALALQKPEAPLVQVLNTDDPDGRSFEDIYGGRAGAMRADDDMEVLDVKPDFMTVRGTTGEKRRIDLYNNLAFNRKSAINSTPMVKAGDRVPRGTLLAKSNFTDDGGTLALGANLRVGIVPYKGYTTDDAYVVSESAAKRLAAVQSVTYAQRFDRQIKGGKSHFTAIFPDVFKMNQLDNLDDKGVVQVGAIVQPDDPLILATSPRSTSSKDLDIGNLSKQFKTARQDSSVIWDGKDPARVVDVAYAKDGTARVLVESISPLRDGDKGVFRAGQKGVAARIIKDAHMPRTMDGRPLEILVNPAGFPSRANNATLFEILLGKVAEKEGKPIKLPSYTKPGERRFDLVKQRLAAAGLQAEEEVFDPVRQRKLVQPIMVGNGFFMRLHHTAASKTSARGQASYDSDEQPAKGGGEGAQSKRLSGLETQVLHSAGAYHNLEEASTLSGQSNPEFWRQVRAGHQPKPPGKPFVWEKFRMLLRGAGMETSDKPGGRMRLGPFVDRMLEQHKPIEITRGDTVSINTLEPVPGGLFDPALMASGKFGKITLPEPMPLPMAETSIRTLLGMTKADFREVLAGRKTIDEVRQKRK